MVFPLFSFQSWQRSCGLLLLFLSLMSPCYPKSNLKNFTNGDQFLLAIANNNLTKAQALLQKGVSVNYRSSNRHLINEVNVRADKINQFMGGKQRYQYASGTAYDIALAKAQATSVKWLLQKGANPALGYFKSRIENTYFSYHYPASYLNLPYKDRAVIVSVGYVLELAVAENNAPRVAQLLAIEPRAIHYQGNRLLPNILRLGKWRLAQLFLSQGRDIAYLTEFDKTLMYPLNSEPTHYSLFQGLLRHAKQRKTLDYQSLILKALKKKDARALKMLVQAGASLNPKHHQPPLFRAVEKNNLANVKLLLSLGANPNQIYQQENLLHKAVSNENIELTRLLLEHHADANIKNRFKQTPIQIAVHKKLPILTQLLLQHRANVEVFDSSNNSLLHIAVRENKPMLLKQFIQHGALINAINNSKKTALFMSVENSKLSMMMALLKAGANPNLKDRDNHTPLQKALTNKNMMFAERLIKAGANVNEKGTDYNKTSPLIIAVQQVRIPLIKVLLEAGAKVNYESRYSPKTALHLAIDKADLTMMGLLLNAKADVNIRDELNRTALHRAVNKKHLGIVSLLLKYHPAINVLDSVGDSALYLAVLEKNLPIVQRLLEARAEPNTVNNSGQTPLTKALDLRKPKIAQVLMKHGAKLNVLNNRQQSPLDIARSRGLQNMVHIMRRMGAKTGQEIGATKALKVKIIP
ncbi:MAG: ankyrin repeat domain-containing protein [Cocleimonas sp.]|nr:ankyrin repeat domain-containing protein [Cocleimonas sp.]